MNASAIRLALLGAALTLASPSGSTHAAEGTGPGVTADSILVGLESKALSFSADEEYEGFRLAIRAANDAGGIHGRRIVERSYARTKTGAASTAEVVESARRLMDEDGVLLVYNHSGPASVVIADMAMKKRVPFMFPHTALVTLDGARYVFTSFPRYDGETAIMYRYLAEKRGVKRMAVLHDENIYGTYFRDRVRQFAPAYGYEFTGAQELKSRQPANVLAEMEALRKGSPDALVLGLYPDQARRTAEAKAALGWRDLRLVTAGPLTDEQYLNIPGGHAEGTIGFCYYPDPNVSTEPGILDYRRQMEKYYPGKPLNRYTLYGYVFGNLMIEGMRRAGPAIDREKFVDAMESIRRWDSRGILPPVSFSKTDHHAQKAGFICELKNGKFEDLSGWLEPK